MTDPLVAKAEEGKLRDLFLVDLFWGGPDHRPIQVEFDDGSHVTATNVSSYKGVRVWEVDGTPGSAVEAAIDREIAKTSTNRLVVFRDQDKQVWRWPSRTVKGSGVISRPARHVHRAGSADPQFAAKIEAIRLPSDRAVDVNELLARVRGAFDVETKNETKRASKLMAQMYGAVEKGYAAGVDPQQRDHEISVTLARVLFLLFGDDTEMWKNATGTPLPDLFQDFVKDHTARDGSDIATRLNALFDVLNAPPARRDGLAAELLTFPYVNGGIFEEKITLPDLDTDFRKAILDASAVDWSTISPAIFGSMFQSVRDAQTRRELGEHYTSEENILKTLNPLFLDELRAEFDASIGRDTPQKRINALNALWKRLGDIRYLDPACGCGNFIIVAYRELRDLELRVMEALMKNQQTEGQGTFSLEEIDWTTALKVTLDHFYGIEIDEWPARIAETAMFLIDRQADLKMKERFGVAPERLPIQRAANITVGNALQFDWSEVLARSANVILAGNPPYAGKEQRTAGQTEDMKLAWGSAYSGEADYVTSWFVKAADYFGTEEGRWAFVTTNSICQGVAVGPVFSALAERGWHLRFAHRTFEWTSDATGKAAVHCVIVGLDRVPGGKRRLFDYPNLLGAPVEIEVNSLNAYLIEGSEVYVKERRHSLSPALATDIRFGSMAADNGGLLVSADEYHNVAKSDGVAVQYLKRFVGAKELLNEKERWCIWMPNGLPEDAYRSTFITARISHVAEFRETKAKDAGVRAAATTPWRFTRVQQPQSEYLCVPRHIPESYEYYPARRFRAEIISGDANFVLDDPDGFYFAVLSSRMFMIWQKTIGGRIKNDPRFASTVTWNTFPLPDLTADQRHALIAAGEDVLAARESIGDISLAAMYSAAGIDDRLRRAHESLDVVMDSVFGLTEGPGSLLLQRQELLFAKYRNLLTQTVFEARASTVKPGRG